MTAPPLQTTNHTASYRPATTHPIVHAHEQ